MFDAWIALNIGGIHRTPRVSYWRRFAIAVLIASGTVSCSPQGSTVSEADKDPQEVRDAASEFFRKLPTADEKDLLPLTSGGAASEAALRNYSRYYQALARFRTNVVEELGPVAWKYLSRAGGHFYINESVPAEAHVEAFQTSPVVLEPGAAYLWIERANGWLRFLHRDGRWLVDRDNFFRSFPQGSFEGMGEAAKLMNGYRDTIKRGVTDVRQLEAQMRDDLSELRKRSQ